MSKNLDFKTTPGGVDTGDATSSSIAPISNGETFDQSVLRRPTEVLRQRMEKLRVEANENRWMRDNDRAVFPYIKGGAITWAGTVAQAGTGALTLGVGASLYLVPAVSPGEPTGAINEGAGTEFPTRFRTVTLTDTVQTLTFQAKLFAFEGAADISIEVVNNTSIGANVLVEVLGDATVTDPGTQPGRRQIVVTYNSNVAHTLQDISNAVVADPVATLLVEELSLSNGAYAAFEQGRTYAAGGSDGVFHQITAAELDSFFATNALRTGDTLAIWFTSVQNRRESIQENGNKHLVPASSLRILREDDAIVDNCVVIGRVVADPELLPFFVFSNGQLLEPGLTTSVLNVGASGLRERLMKFDGGQINNAFYFTGTSGSAFIGVDSTNWNYLPALPSLAATLNNIDSSLNSLFTGTAADRIRGDVNRGLVAPPVPNDAGAYGAEYVGLDTATFNVIPPGANRSVQESIESIDVLLTGGLKRAVTFPGQGVTHPLIQPGDTFEVAIPDSDSNFSWHPTLVGDIGLSATPVVATNGRYVAVCQAGAQRLIDMGTVGGDGEPGQTTFAWFTLGALGATFMVMTKEWLVAAGQAGGVWWVEGVELANPEFNRWSVPYASGEVYALGFSDRPLNSTVYVGRDSGTASVITSLSTNGGGPLTEVTWNAVAGTVIKSIVGAGPHVWVGGEPNTAGFALRRYADNLTSPVDYLAGASAEDISSMFFDGSTLFAKSATLADDIKTLTVSPRDNTVLTDVVTSNYSIDAEIVAATADYLILHRLAGNFIYLVYKHTLSAGNRVKRVAITVHHQKALCTDGAFIYSAAATEGLKMWAVDYTTKTFQRSSDSEASFSRRTMPHLVYPAE